MIALPDKEKIYCLTKGKKNNLAPIGGRVRKINIKYFTAIILCIEQCPTWKALIKQWKYLKKFLKYDDFLFFAISIKTWIFKVNDEPV